jgi:hypothetical protein
MGKLKQFYLYKLGDPEFSSPLAHEWSDFPTTTADHRRVDADCIAIISAEDLRRNVEALVPQHDAEKRSSVLSSRSRSHVSR